MKQSGVELGHCGVVDYTLVNELALMCCFSTIWDQKNAAKKRFWLPRAGSLWLVTKNLEKEGNFGSTGVLSGSLEPNWHVEKALEKKKERLRREDYGVRN